MWSLTCRLYEDIYDDKREGNLEALSVDDRWTGFVIFLFRDPHLLESRKRSQNGATDPDRVFSLWWCDDLDFHCRWCQGSDLLLHAVSDAWVHGGATGEDSICVQVLSDIDITLHDRVVSCFMNTGSFHSEEWWLEKCLWASESFITNSNDLNRS